MERTNNLHGRNTSHPSLEHRANNENANESLTLGRPTDERTNNNSTEADASAERGIHDPTEDGKPEESNHNLVYWEAIDESLRPINWPSSKKWLNLAAISSLRFLTPLASSMMAPAAEHITRSLGSTSSTIRSFIVSIYILGYAVGPLFLAPMSELYGRLWVYHISNFMFIIWNVAAALSKNIPSMLVFRFLAGVAGSCPITLGNGSVADCMRRYERGKAMAIFSAGPLLGPVIGPIAGGFIAETVSWRWIFWVIAIAVSRSLPPDPFPLLEASDIFTKLIHFSGWYMCSFLSYYPKRDI